MEIWKYPLLILIGFIGSLLQRVTGFGFGIFMMMFLPGLMGSSVEAAAMAGLCSCCTCTYNAIRLRKSIQWKLVVPTITASLVTVPLAVRFSAQAPENLVRVLLGVVLILLSIYFLFFGEAPAAAFCGRRVVRGCCQRRAGRHVLHGRAAGGAVSGAGAGR